MLGSGGRVVVEPALGRAADSMGYASSYLFAAVISAAALPFIYRSRRQRPEADAGAGG